MLYDLAQPSEGEGTRAIWCAFSDICLTKAIANNWESFHCSLCGFCRDEPFPALDYYMDCLREKENVRAKFSDKVSQNI